MAKTRRKKLGTNGDCFEVAAQLVVPELYDLKLENVPDMTDPLLVHGYPRLQCEPYSPHCHAWVEYTVHANLPDGMCDINGDTRISLEMVADFSNGKQVVMSRHYYYSLGHIDPDLCKRYTADEARKQIFENETYGPWGDILEGAL